MKNIIPVILIISYQLVAFVQYDYGLDICGQDAKIEGKLNLDNGGQIIFIGSDSGVNNTTGVENNFYGASAGLYNTTGDENSFYGTASGQGNTTGNGNSFYGNSSGLLNTIGGTNAFFGDSSGVSNRTGRANCFIGYAAGGENTTGSENVALVSRAGVQYIIGQYNIAIESGAGPTQTNSIQNNRLYIDVQSGFSGNVNPLIYGEFDNDLTIIHGTLHITETAKLEPRASPPSTCTTAVEYGLIYYDNSDTQHVLKVCTNTGWQNMNKLKRIC